MSLKSVGNSFRLVTANRTHPALKGQHQNLGKGVLSKIARVFNSIFPLGKQNSYIVRERDELLLFLMNADSSVSCFILIVAFIDVILYLQNPYYRQ